MMSKFSVGDVVSLKAGGQGMTIEQLDTKTASCVWLDKDGKVRRDCFPIDCLRAGDSRYDGVMNLIIEGYNATPDEIADYKRGMGIGNA